MERQTVTREDALWDVVAAQYADKRAQLEARIANAPALPMFDEDGRWLLDDYEEQGGVTSAPADQHVVCCG